MSNSSKPRYFPQHCAHIVIGTSLHFSFVLQPVAVSVSTAVVASSTSFICAERKVVQRWDVRSAISSQGAWFRVECPWGRWCAIPRSRTRSRQPSLAISTITWLTDCNPPHSVFFVLSRVSIEGGRGPPGMVSRVPPQSFHELYRCQPRGSHNQGHHGAIITC